MKRDISPALKGLITGAIMLALAFVFYYADIPGNSPAQYLMWIIYGAGIVWTLVDYRKSPGYTGKFGDLFGQGFRCFIIVTLMMVLFVGLFSKMHPEMADEASKAYKEQLMTDLKDKKTDKTPAEIENEAAMVKKHYTTTLLFASVFGYLMIGAVVTAGASAILIARKQ